MHPGQLSRESVTMGHLNTKRHVFRRDDTAFWILLCFCCYGNGIASNISLTGDGLIDRGRK